MKKYAERSGFDLFRSNIWYFLVGLSKATNYCTLDAQYIHIQGNRLSNRGVLRSEPSCSIRKTGIINGEILIVSRIDKIKAQIGKADRANTYYK
jgi:hypothetical protein